jgi:hypothetical protein
MHRLDWREPRRYKKQRGIITPPLLEASPMAAVRDDQLRGV